MLMKIQKHKKLGLANGCEVTYLNHKGLEKDLMGQLLSYFFC